MSLSLPAPYDSPVTRAAVGFGRTVGLVGLASRDLTSGRGLNKIVI